MLILVYLQYVAYFFVALWVFAITLDRFVFEEAGSRPWVWLAAVLSAIYLHVTGMSP